MDRGTHGELLSRCERYQDLVRRQLRGGGDVPASSEESDLHMPSEHSSDAAMPKEDGKPAPIIHGTSEVPQESNGQSLGTDSMGMPEESTAGSLATDSLAVPLIPR